MDQNRLRIKVPSQSLRVFRVIRCPRPSYCTEMENPYPKCS